VATVPSSQWTRALWGRLAEVLAEEVGFDAANYRYADLEPDEPNPEDADVILQAEPVARQPEGEV
jgi:hypothetical protein